MALRSDASTWGSVARLLHWLIALLVIALLVGGLTMVELKNGPAKLQWYALHKSVGITVLALMLLRLAWRTIDARPADVPGLPRWQARLALVAQRGFYALLLALPLSGWLYNSAANFPLRWFGWLSLPPLSGPDKALKALAHDTHEVLAWITLVLLVLHVTGALKHHLIDGDATLQRMLPFLRGRGTPSTTNPESNP